MKIPRVLLAAGASGSGKTTVTCALLMALKEMGLGVTSFKCGPDYIDPMFHAQVLGVRSRNLDTFFAREEVIRYLLQKNAGSSDIAVMEGVMGYYDGVAGISTKASAYDLASVTDTPVILLVNTRGMSVSIAAFIKGFLEYKKDSRIRGVIFNQMSPMLYERAKKLVEEELPVKVLGYVPKLDFQLESRHLGLVLPEEIPALMENLHKAARIVRETLDIEGILKLARQAPEMEEIGEEHLAEPDKAFLYYADRPLRIGLAQDEAFCFFYEDNFRLLRQMGAELVPFSLLHDVALPEDLDGLLLMGGYPELYAKELEENNAMRESLLRALKDGLPCIAECGGFMYLHEELQGMDGAFHKGVGLIPGRVFRTEKLQRFGYIELTENIENCLFGYPRDYSWGHNRDSAQTSSGETAQNSSEDSPRDESSKPPLTAHEFHYFDSENCGEAFHAKKPLSKRGWNCIHSTPTLFAGFPHLYFYGNPSVAAAFLRRCCETKK